MADRPKFLRVAEIGVAAVVLFGTPTVVAAYSYLEEKSHRPALLAKGDNLELWGICDGSYGFSEITEEGDLIQLISDGSNYSAMAKAKGDRLVGDALVKGGDFGANLGVRFPEPEEVSSGRMQMAARSNLFGSLTVRGSRLRLPTGEIVVTQQVMQQIEGPLTCPSTLLTRIRDQVVNKIQGFLSPKPDAPALS